MTSQNKEINAYEKKQLKTFRIWSTPVTSNVIVKWNIRLIRKKNLKSIFENDQLIFFAPKMVHCHSHLNLLSINA